MTTLYRVRNWTKFQHYKDRNPPWIKLHVEILASEDWVTLDDASKLLALVCMVIAAKHDGNVPNNPDYIKRVAYLSRRPNLKPLLDCGFLEIPQALASDCKHLLADARPETETETETEKKVPSLRSGVPEVDEISAFEAYNSLAEELGWAVAQRLTPKRKTALRRRLVECGGLTGWLGAMAKARKSAFLRGETGRTNGHEDWQPDLDFFLQESTFTKLMEGKYNGNGHAKPRTAHDRFLAGGAAFIRELDDPERGLS